MAGDRFRSGYLPRPSVRGFPHRPASNHGRGRSGTARVKGAYGVPPGSPTLDPHRTAPKVGSYRGDAGGLPVRLS
ncbi:hypothetical protein GCM10010524_71280 [Streptomyces mexicanus]